MSKDCANRYFVSILVEEEVKPLPVVNNMVGLDLGMKSIAGFPLAKPAMSASMSCKIFLSTCVNGFAQSVAHFMTAIPMLQEIFWPRGSRCRPVEEVSDPKRAKARRATPNEAGTSQPRGGEASGFIQGRMSQTKQAEFSSCEKGMGALSGLK